LDNTIGTAGRRPSGKFAKALLTLGDKFLIKDNALASTETCLEIKFEGEMLEGTYKNRPFLNQAELSREAGDAQVRPR
jgi:hypothetical protein